MNLRKEHWDNCDIGEYHDYLQSMRGRENERQFEKNIVGTKLDCLAIKSDIVKKIANELFLGNYIEFLSYWPWNNHTETLIIGCILNKLSDFKMFKKYLFKYANYCDNWATCDIIKPKLNQKNREDIYCLAKQYIKNKKPFVRRVGFKILFNFINDKIDDLLKIFDEYNDENDYYVNMIIAWLICECFIKQREKTLAFLKNNNLNSFALNKSIQKCRESLRVNKDDKLMLLSLKK